MPVNDKFVLLLKAPKKEDEPDKYEQLLIDNGYTVKVIKTIGFEYINLELFYEKLINPNLYSGLIFTSPRCVQSVDVALNGAVLDDTWRDKDNYVVGESTYESAFKILNLDCKGKESGNAENLSVEIIKSKNKYNKPFLAPCSNLKSDFLKNQLSENDIRIEEVILYNTILSSDIEDDFVAATANYTNLPAFIVFFSPSALLSADSVLPKIMDIKMIAIGPSTQKALEAKNIPVYGVCEKPTPEHLLKVIDN